MIVWLQVLGDGAIGAARFAANAADLIQVARGDGTGAFRQRFNGRISEVLATTSFRSRDDLQTTLERYEKLYNDHLPQRALGHKTPLQAIRTWQTERPELFNGKSKNQSGLDS